MSSRSYTPAVVAALARCEQIEAETRDRLGPDGLRRVEELRQKRRRHARFVQRFDAMRRARKSHENNNGQEVE